MSVRLFVGNLPYDATEADLREHFSAVAPLSYIYLPLDRETGKPRGFAFIEYSERSHALEAINRFNSQMFKGRALAVNEARAREDRPAGGSQGYSPRPSFTPGSAPPPSGGPSGGKNFGPDAAPRGRRKPSRAGSKSERGPKGPIREKPGGQLVFGGDDEEFHDDDLSSDNFASRVDDADDQDTE
ncbi:MAG TPA: RNA-binding protein [Blastocatellia bacterium]|nr:RNA-binding protein [Blastocatellia bacterium]